jgi:Yip1 domain
MELVQRVRSIILKPKEEWAKIKGETATVASVFTNYVLPLAAIPPAAQFIGRMLFRVRLPYRGDFVWGVGHALGYAILSYGLSLIVVYLFALAMNSLATAFSSTPNMVQAVKLSAYSMTPGWLGGIFNLVPALYILGTLASLYGLYLLFLGLQAPLLETPKDRAVGYMGAGILVVVVLYVVFGLIPGAIFAVRSL